MRVNHNIPALNTTNSLQKNYKVIENSTRKTSSGLRINQAADDSAGSGVSEGMRAQIRGLQQAERNIQDGISFIETVEGGLSEIENPNLQRLRELAVQSATGTLAPSDRQAIQREVDQLIGTIDDIANHTEFNGAKVLRPPVLNMPPAGTSGKTDIVFIIDSTGSMSSPINNVKTNLDSFVNSLTSRGIDVQLGLVDYKDVNSDSSPLVKGNSTNDVPTFKSYLNAISVGGGGDFPESGLEGITDPVYGALSFPLRADATKNFIFVTDALVHDNADGDGGDGGSVYDIEAVATEVAARGIKLNVVGPASDSTVSAQLKRLSEPTGGSYLDIYTNFASQLDTLARNIASDTGTPSDFQEMPDFSLQVGPNYGEIYSIKLFDTRSQKLGIKDLSVDTQAKAIEAIGKIDKAIESVSAARATFGSHQNALEHFKNNASNYKSNITAAESQMTDADLSKEITNLTNRKILLESAQAMLVQANQLNQSVLQIIK